MNDFQIGELYTLNEIVDVLGGEIQAYLAYNKDSGRIVCGRFKQDMNPDAPDEIQVGSKDRVVKRAIQYSRQTNTEMPVFIKHSITGETSRVWEYKGEYKYKELCDDPAEIRIAEQKSGRHGKLTYLLRLEKV